MSNEEEKGSGEEEADEAAAPDGVSVVDTGVVRTAGAEEANRTLTPLRIILFDLDNWNLVFVLETAVLF